MGVSENGKPLNVHFNKDHDKPLFSETPIIYWRQAMSSFCWPICAPFLRPSYVRGEGENSGWSEMGLVLLGLESLELQDPDWMNGNTAKQIEVLHIHQTKSPK